MRANNRQLLDALNEIPAKHRGWLTSGDPELWAFYGFGVVLNSAQLDLFADVTVRWPAGAIHQLEWANRTGKTTGVVLLEMWTTWYKWRYHNENFDDWLAYLYRVLHSAPLNRLMGYAWSTADALIAGRADQQRSPITNRQRPGVLRPFFEAGTGEDDSGSDVMFVKCANGAQVDFLSTQAGAARLESMAWWLIVWDEYLRQQPISDVPLMIDQTYLPRSSDYMAPLIFAATATEDAEPVLAELEELAEENPRDWHISRAERKVNFSQSKESIERQMRLSIDKEVAGRSVMGLSGQSGFGIFPHFVVDNLFTNDLPEQTPAAEVPEGYIAIGSFDHALSGDENVLHVMGVPWPIDPAQWKEKPIIGLAERILRSSRTLTPDEQLRFAVRESEPYNVAFMLFDSTSEGGLGIFRSARAAGVRALEFIATGREMGSRVTNKELSLQRLQRMTSFGLEVELDDTGWVKGFPEPEGRFGLIRLPAAWRRTRRQIATYKRYDEKLTQDRVMTLAMFAWRLAPYYEAPAGARQGAQKWNVVARRRRSLTAGGTRKWA